MSNSTGKHQPYRSRKIQDGSLVADAFSFLKNLYLDENFEVNCNMGDAPEPRPNIGCNLITVDSPVGTITGFIDKKTPKVAQFLGIPFAEPPIGSLRWLPPVSKSHMEHIDATAFGPSCCQIVGGAPSVYNSDAPEFKINDGTSEDCLTLSIWVPAFAINRHQPVSLPVIVWLFGGAYAIGGSTVPYQNPCNWVESSQRHIVVAIKCALSLVYNSRRLMFDQLPFKHFWLP